ncbi:MAG: hypothetical protein ACREUA_05195 [Burkholderiales bacterium]
MANDKPEQTKPEEESKKDTVRINLPPGLTSRAPATQPISPAPPPMKPPGPPGAADDEAKKQTAVMGKPVATPKPKTDTSRVQVPGAKAGEEGRVKLKKEAEPTAAAGPVAMAEPAMVAARGGPSAALSFVAMVLAVAVTAYLAWIVLG